MSRARKSGSAKGLSPANECRHSSGSSRKRPRPRPERLPDEEQAMKELLELIVKSLVDKPDEVSVTEIDSEQTTVFELRVAQEDLGKVIGRQGRTARGIRTMLGAAGMKLRKRLVLEILE